MFRNSLTHRIKQIYSFVAYKIKSGMQEKTQRKLQLPTYLVRVCVYDKKVRYFY